MAYRRPTTLSKRGAEFIGRFEGLVLRPYNDPLGYATVGYGHLLGKHRVTPAERAKYAHFSRVDAIKLLQADAAKASKAVHDHVKPKINQAQHDALVSFVFNVGVGDANNGFLGSTLLKKLNRYPGTDKGVVGRNAIEDVHEELLKWVNKGSAAEVGLTRRRNAESHLFESGRYH